jgi:multidrug resistance efflux pump
MPKRQIWELQNEGETLRLQAESLKRQVAFLGLEPKAIQKLEQADLLQPASLVEFVQTVPVRAPTAGLIVGFHVVPGQVVHRDEPLFEIHDLSRVWVKGYVYECDVSRVEPGQGARVHFPAYPDLEAIGKVVRVSPLMDDNERVLPVWVELANPEHRLKDGMLARITLTAKSKGEDGRPGIAQLAPVETRK